MRQHEARSCHRRGALTAINHIHIPVEKWTMKSYALLCIILGTQSVRAFLPPGLHTGLAASSAFGQPALSRKGKAEMQCGNAASPVNSAETLQRTSDLAIQGIGKTKKLALLGSTVCETGTAAKIERHTACQSKLVVHLTDCWSERFMGPLAKDKAATR